MKQEAHHGPAFARCQRGTERQLAVVDDGMNPASVGAVLEHHVAGAGRSRVLEQAPDAARGRAVGPGRPGRAGAPAGGDLPEGGAFLAQRGGHDAVPAQRQQIEAQPLVGLMALGDQAAAVGIDRAEPPEARIHCRSADEAAAVVLSFGSCRRLVRRRPVRPGRSAQRRANCIPPGHEPSPGRVL